MNQGNPLLGQILGGVFGHAMGRRGMGGGMARGGMGGLGGGLGGAALGGILASVLGRRGMGGGMGGGLGGGMARPGGMGGVLAGGRGQLMLMLLPLAMRWVQRNGGIGAVLKRFQQQGYGNQARTWMSTGDNDALDEHAIHEVVGQDELSQLSQRLGVPQHEVAAAFAEILPEMVNQLTPQGDLPPQADEVLEDGRIELERELEQVQAEEPARH
jgi:uncharacterized protein YidB (DUF937 family)